MLLDLTHLSYSSISSYQLCPLGWRMRYVDKIKTPTSPNLVFGSAFHETIEQLITILEPGENPPSPVEVWSEKWKGAISKDVTWENEKPEEMGNLGIRMLGHPDSRAMIGKLAVALEWEDGGPLVEKKVELRVPGVPIPIIGYIDLLGTDGVPYDLKTAGKSWTQDQAAKESQPTYYLAALNQAGYGGNPDRKFRHVVWVKGRTPKVQEFETTRSPADMFRLFGTIKAVWDAIQAGSFPPVTSGWKHSERFCDFWHHCPAGGKA